MHRTQLYLDEAHYQYIVSLARKRSESIAQAFRDLIEEHMARHLVSRAQDPFFQVIGIGRGGGKPVAEHDEDYLYGMEQE